MLEDTQEKAQNQKSKSKRNLNKQLNSRYQRRQNYDRFYQNNGFHIRMLDMIENKQIIEEGED